MINYSSGDLLTVWQSTLLHPSELVKLSLQLTSIEYTAGEGLTLGYAVGENNASGGTSNLDLTTST